MFIVLKVYCRCVGYFVPTPIYKLASNALSRYHRVRLATLFSNSTSGPSNSRAPVERSCPTMNSCLLASLRAR
jgi:hypothetical protein